MNVVATVIADEDFRNGAAVIGIVAAAALLILAIGKVLDRWFTSEQRGPAETVNAAGIDIVDPLYLAEDCTLCPPAETAPQVAYRRRPRPFPARWKPTDAEIAAFLDNSTPNGGPQ